MKEYVIRPIALSEGTRDKGQWTYRMNHGQTCLAGSYVWYIEGSEPKVLVDSGAKTETFLARGFQQETIQSLEEGLARLGLKPEDIGIVIQTHLHFDHIEFGYKLTRAKFIVQKAELDYALNPHPLSRLGYDPQLFQNLNLEVIEGDEEIMEGIRVMLTPGHSPGGQSVAINTREGTAIITGLCCTTDNFEPSAELRDKGFEVVTPALHTNAEEAYDSTLRIKKAADIIIPLHEPTALIKDRIP